MLPNTEHHLFFFLISIFIIFSINFKLRTGGKRGVMEESKWCEGSSLKEYKEL